MLGLWSMAAQLRACHCRACLRATNTVARRATTSTTNNPRRRKFLASDVFTACYTAIMATAAVADAGRKDKRRRELDSKITQARNSLAVMMEESHARDLAQVITSANPAVFYDRSLDTVDILTSICTFQPEFLRGVKEDRRKRDEALGRLRKRLGLKWHPGVPEGSATLAKCEKVMASEDRNPGILHREPKTETQLSKTTDMINDLVDRLISEAYWQSESEAPRSHPSLNSPDSARTMIRFLRSDGYPSYTHPEANLEETVEARARLNEVNLQILDNWNRRHRERIVAKICYNLLVCGVPPAIQNYNALILRFTMLGEHRLAQAVVDSFLYKSHLKPTEATFLCLLHHYRISGDIVGFWGLLRRLFGHDPRGIGLRRKATEDVPRHSYLRSWVAVKDITVIKGYYVECAELNQNVVEAMMDGLIDFGMLHQAAKLFSVCLQESWAVNGELLGRLLHSCIVSLDHMAAKAIIQGLLNNVNQAISMLLGPTSITQSTVKQLRHLLNICHATTLPGGENSQLDAPASPSSTANLDRLATAIWMRETSTESRVMTMKLQRATQALLEERPLGARLDLAISILGDEAGRRARKLEKMEHTGRTARVDWLEKQCAAAAREIEAAEHVICNVLAKQRPRAIKNWWQFSPDVRIERRIEQATAFVTPGTLQHQVAVWYARSNEIDKQLKAALLKALPAHLAKPLVATRNNTGDVSLKKVIIHFERYTTALRERQAEEAAAEAAARNDPFAHLLEKLPRPNISFWQRVPASAAATSSGQEW